LGYTYRKIDGLQVPEHRCIWEEHHGKIPEGAHIHHINGIKDDNRIENLECLSNLDHMRKHSGFYKNDRGEWIKPCKGCGIHKSLETEFYKTDKKISTLCMSCHDDDRIIAVSDPNRNPTFLCAVCRKTARRGHLIKVREGLSKGTNVKTCRETDCIVKASWGEI